MAQLINLRNLVSAMVMTAVTLGMGMANQASASDGYEPHAPVCHYKTIITFEYRTEKFVQWVVQVDDYGYEHKVPVVKYRTIKVPVKKLVKVCHDDHY